jgi:uncharacterized protein
MTKQRLVVDTNVLVSHLLVPDSIADQVVVRVMTHEVILMSEAALTELSEVLARPKFNRYFSAEAAQDLLATLVDAAELVPITQIIRACRDPRDDKFLELAVNGEADTILTGDADLLALDPFQGIAIMTPAEWLSRQQQGEPL